MKHVKHLLGGAIVVVVAVAPMVLANPSAQHYIEKHPAVAVYLPLAVGVLRAAVKAWNERSAAALS